MALDFQRIKEIPIADVCARYKIALRYRGEWGSAMCPLPTHKQGEREKTFSISTAKNYWKCWSASCNEKAGCKGGDVINLVALMGGCSQLAAAKTLAEWFHIQEKTAPHTAEPSNKKPKPQTTSDHNGSSESVKYMASIDAWFAGIIQGDQEETDAFRARLVKAIKEKLIESFKAGKLAARSAA